MSQKTSTRAWKKALDPFAREYADFSVSVSDRIASLSDGELRHLAKATNRPTETNCSWAIYAVVPEVRDAVQREAYKRRRGAATEPGEQ